jgi:ADP-heptose:LPS heptosyltransferase
VFAIGSLGDTVLSVPALVALRAHVGPGATITLLHNLAPDDRVSPTAVIPPGLVDDVVTFRSPGAGPADTLRRLAGIPALAAHLRRRRFDAVVNLALSDRSARSLRQDRLFYRACGIPTLVGLEPEVPGAPEAEVRLARLARAGVPAELGSGPWLLPPASSRAEAAAWRAAHAPVGAAPIVTVVTGTLMDAKRWPFERWVELGARLRQRHGLTPVVVGGPADRDEGDRLVTAWGGGANAAGALEPLASAALLSEARLHVGTDTGTTHLAGAVGTPVVALFSHRAPIAQWTPMGTGHQVADHPVPCAGCQAVTCPVAGHPCMTGISVDQVWAKVELALAGPPATIR